MGWKPREWILIGVLFSLMTAASVAQVNTTQVADTVYHADGTPAGGTVLISWPAFTTATGATIASGTTSVTIGAHGALSVNLTPNTGASPIGSYYTAILHLDDGTVSREYWVVPVSAYPVKISAIESTVLPTAVAMQTVSKSYVDTAIAAAVTGHPLDSTPYVLKNGDSMTGPLALPGDPVSSLQAADKNYVDQNIAALASGLGQKVTTLPTGSQTVTQPTGSELAVNRLNDVEYASQYATGGNTNGIANAASSPDCAGGCQIKVEQHYGAEGYGTAALNSQTHITDARGGAQVDSYLNPRANSGAGIAAAETVDAVSTVDTASLVQQTGTSTPYSVGLRITHTGLAGGSNLAPGDYENVPYFKMGYSALDLLGIYNTQGQHGLMPQEIDCFGVGDCLLGSRFIYASGGWRDGADEGAHLYDTAVVEDSRVFRGTCINGCTPGSTNLFVRQDAGPGTQGDGRFLINMNPAKTISSAANGGSIVNGFFANPHATVQFSGTNFPVSVFLSTGQVIPSQSNNMVPGTVTFQIATSGMPSGFAANTAAIGNTSGLACVVDQNTAAGPDYEMAPYTVVDGTHLRMTFAKPHNRFATLSFGGLCGYGIEQTVDTQSGIRQVFPVVGSYTPTAIYYDSQQTAVLGAMNQTDGFLNINTALGSLIRSGGVVTINIAAPLPQDLTGLRATISGAVDPSFNGSFVVTRTGSGSFTYAQSGPDASTTGATISYLNGGFVLYPMAEVLSVFNPASRYVDGTMTLAPNNVAWASNDPVEQPHYFQEYISADIESYGQTVPRPTIPARSGKTYLGNNAGAFTGWSINNQTATGNYLGYGGTHSVPQAAYESLGVWLHNMDMTAGEQAIFSIHCNMHGCNNWNSGYNLFELQDAGGYGVIHYDTQTSNLSINLRGSNYSFSPLAFTAGTINVQTLNAGTVSGSINASSITSGTIPTAALPLFGAAGPAHAPGGVPDPGASAGTTRFLREDGTWAAPASAGGATGSVTITGGSIDGATIGASTPAAIHATQVAASSYDATGGSTPWTFVPFAGSYDSNNGTTDSGGWRGYFAANQNIGFNTSNLGVPATCNTAEILRFVKDYGEQGGAVIGGIDRSSNLCGWSGLLMPSPGLITWNRDTGLSRLASGTVAVGNGNAGDASGSLAAASVSASLYKGPATAPSGTCSAIGWAFSQDGHATFCNGSTWVTKI